MTNEPDRSPDGGNGTPPEPLPPLDLRYVVTGIFVQALVKLGLLPDPVRQKPVENLPFAKRLIDILDELKARTEDRLEPAEAEYLEECLLELKAQYLKKANILAS